MLHKIITLRLVVLVKFLQKQKLLVLFLLILHEKSSDLLSLLLFDFVLNLLLHDISSILLRHVSDLVLEVRIKSH